MYPGYLSSSDRELSEKDEGIPSDQDISQEYLKYSVEYLKGGDIVTQYKFKLSPMS